MVVVVVLQMLNNVWLFSIRWTAAQQALLSSTISWSLLKFRSIKSMMLSNNLIFCHPFLSPLIFSSIRVFSNESALCIMGPKLLELQLQHQSFQWIFRVHFLNQDWLVWSPCSPRDSQESCPVPIWKHQFFSTQPSLSFTSIHGYWKNHSFDYMDF